MRLSAEEVNRILEKAEYIEEAVTVLARKQSLDEQLYASDREQRAIVEREFQTAIEACIDIAGIILKASDVEMPATNARRFKELNSKAILTDETAQRMQNAAGFRNILTHNYGNDINNEAVYKHLQNELEWFVLFLREIRSFVANSVDE